jgi:hypothetical protein
VFYKYKEKDMKRSRGILAGTAIVIAVVFLVNGITGFRGEQESDPGEIYLLRDELQRIKSFSLPDTLYFAGERVPLENFDTRESLDRELNTNAYLHSSTMLVIKRANRYFPVIEPILKAHGVPDDFKYISVAESNLSNAVSPVRATGFWQFMPATAREYGLEISPEIDERYNLEKSTAAACRYLLKSYERYGDWALVAASYNGGTTGVDRQIGIQGQRSYYDLLLTEETARYLFRVLSFKVILSDPEAYGFDIPAEHLYPVIEFETVTVDTAVASFADFAAQYGTNYKILKALNPWLREPFLVNRHKKSYEIKIPVKDARISAYKREE